MSVFTQEKNYADAIRAAHLMDRVEMLNEFTGPHLIGELAVRHGLSRPVRPVEAVIMATAVLKLGPEIPDSLPGDKHNEYEQRRIDVFFASVRDHVDPDDIALGAIIMDLVELRNGRENLVESMTAVQA